jgi:Flp pilus assembly protein TadG
MIRRILSRLTRGAKREEGTATVEFVLTLPAVLFVFLAAFESGVYMVRYILLDRALDMTVRELRLGMIQTPALDKLKTSICDNTGLVADCKNNLQLEMFSVDTKTWAFPKGPISCRDRAEAIKPDTLKVGVENEMMLIRACLTSNAIFPTTSIAAKMEKDSQGGYYVTAVSGFANEP